MYSFISKIFINLYSGVSTMLNVKKVKIDKIKFLL